ncbi:MAG TPA: hemerythrin domain-containing protein [Polyangia bacterium]
MSENLWQVPSHPMDADHARRTVFAQHRALRGLLGRASATASAALEGRAPSPDAVASAIGDIRTTFDVHLTFEEKVLIPILEADLPLGPERAQHLREEHAQQRGFLASLHHEALSAPTLPTLSVKLAQLVDWLLRDMVHEEQTLLTPDVIRDDQITIDQNTG